MKRIPMDRPFIFIFLMALAFPCFLQSQKLDTVRVKDATYQVKEFPALGNAFGTSSYSFDVRNAAAKGAILAIQPASIGKVRNCRFFAAVKGGELLACGVETSGPKAAKMLLKQLRLQYGAPYSLTTSKDIEVLQWNPSAAQPNMIRYQTTPKDTKSSVWISLR
jgi:hypothetical protein